jgi:hypothetical protein
MKIIVKTVKIKDPEQKIGLFVASMMIKIHRIEIADRSGSLQTFEKNNIFTYEKSFSTIGVYRFLILM